MVDSGYWDTLERYPPSPGWRIVSLEQMLQYHYHLLNIQQFTGLISGALLPVLYPVDANVILNTQGIDCNNEGLKYLQQNTK